MILLQRELKANLRGIIIWMIVCGGVMTMSLSMFPSFAKQGDYLAEVLASFPEEMLAAINASSIDFTNVLDYFGYIYQYVLLAVGIMSMMLGVSVLSKEEGEKTIEFLNAKPMTRSTIVTEKILFVLTQIVCVSAFLSFMGYVLTNGFNDGRIALEPFIYVFLGTILIGTIFASIGLVISVFVIKTKRYIPIALGMVFTMYFMSMMVAVSDKLSGLKYISPFSLFNIGDLINTLSIDYENLLIALTLIIGLVTTTYILYNRKDFYT
ncbi:MULTISPECIES: ABC transporter permease subunit [unclassified Fusibacter]|uniref:ABC transporter permease subunit n=1 Tax=unclassified Fusibacter TaxID=2624464 RepID=UPI00101141E1|nr:MULTISPECIES: ABC transporter permease subunit [unclassified Fusibacter]MCK8060722.1 ABC transporter permease [Fusibacter sp. A2]NPE23017.1 ABC transporter permease subunit [Fusibacter sp. A1]RXV59689.1 hypothetical protein DWB64_14320 [Fusibacter sp. A1]